MGSQRVGHNWATELDWTEYLAIKPVNPKGNQLSQSTLKENQSWISTGRTDAEAETPMLWPPDAKNWLIGKDPDAGKDWRQKEKGMTEDEMTGWTRVWARFGNWWWAGKPGMLQSMGLQRVGHNSSTELNWNIWQGRQEYPMRKGWSLQQILLGKVDIHIQNSEIGPFCHTMPPSLLEMNARFKRKSW